MKPKPKKCKICGEKFSPFQSTVKVCSPKCALSLVRSVAKKKEAVAQKEVRKDTSRRREALKTISDWKKEVKDVFNKFIRLRDTLAGHGCISCGTKDPSLQYAAGHYRSVGACAELRFCEENVHLQCNRRCNKELSGNLIEYRINLVKRIGIEKVEWLESKHEPKRYRIEDLKELKIIYRDKIKILEGKI